MFSFYDVAPTEQTAKWAANLPISATGRAAGSNQHLKGVWNIRRVQSSRQARLQTRQHNSTTSLVNNTGLMAAQLCRAMRSTLHLNPTGLRYRLRVWVATTSRFKVLGNPSRQRGNVVLRHLDMTDLQPLRGWKQGGGVSPTFLLFMVLGRTSRISLPRSLPLR